MPTAPAAERRTRPFRADTAPRTPTCSVADTGRNVRELTGSAPTLARLARYDTYALQHLAGNRATTQMLQRQMAEGQPAVQRRGPVLPQTGEVRGAHTVSFPRRQLLAGHVNVWVSGEVELVGSARVGSGESPTEVTAEATSSGGSASYRHGRTTLEVGRDEDAFAATVERELSNNVSVAADIKAGEPGSLAVKIGGLGEADLGSTGIIVEFPEITIGGQWDPRRPVVLEVSSRVRREIDMGSWTFAGLARPKLKIEIGISPALAAAAAAKAAGAAKGAALFVKGVFVAGQLGTLTAAGAVAVGGGVAIVALAVPLAGLALMGRGQVQHFVRTAFARGHAFALADLTAIEPHYVWARRYQLVDVDWRGVVAEQSGPGRLDMQRHNIVFRAGQAAAVQAVERYALQYGGRAWWHHEAPRHRTRYGASDFDRRQQYERMLIGRSRNNPQSIDRQLEQIRLVPPPEAMQRELRRTMARIVGGEPSE